MPSEVMFIVFAFVGVFAFWWAHEFNKHQDKLYHLSKWLRNPDPLARSIEREVYLSMNKTRQHRYKPPTYPEDLL